LPEHLGRRKGSDLIYAGKVDHGFDMDSAKELEARLKPLISKTQTLCKEDRASRHLGRARAHG
jgi:bifunctional non-homologous end joining protein LigD